MLKKLLDKEAFDKLHEELQKLYKVAADGKYHLQLEDDDAEPLRRAKEHEVGLRRIAEQERDTAISERDAARTEAQSLKDNAGKSVNDVREQLKTEYEGRIDKLKADHAKEKASMEATIKRIFVTDVASRIANEITDVPELLIPLIEQRLQVEVIDGEPVTRVLSKEGKASPMTPDELRDEYLQNTKLARIMRANGSSGGGASGGAGGSGAPVKKLSEMGDAERAKMAHEQPEEWKRVLAENA